MFRSATEDVPWEIRSGLDMNIPEDSKVPPVEGVYTPIGTRRRFFEWITAMIAGAVGLGLAVPLVGYVVSPAMKRRTQPWVDIGRIGDR